MRRSPYIVIIIAGAAAAATAAAVVFLAVLQALGRGLGMASARKSMDMLQ